MLRASISLVVACFLCLPAAAAAAGPPSIVNAPPSNVRDIEMTLNFSIDPEGLATSYYVEYGETASYGSRAALYDEEVPAGDEPVALSQLLSVWGLQRDTTYHYRVVAINSAGTTYGDDQEVTTADEPAPAVVTGAAGEDTGSSVVLRGTVDPEGLPVTKCRFHHVTQDQFERFGFTYSLGPKPEPMGILVPCEETPAEIGSGSEPVPVHAVVSSYLAGRHYFRLEAENAYDAAAPGEAEQFGGEAPGIEYLAPSPLRDREATLRFAVDPEGLETEYEVEYGREEGKYFEFHYLWDGVIPAGDEAVIREAELPAYWEGGLLPGTEYHWRVVARNGAGTTEGPDETFTTPDEPAPLLTTGAVGAGASGAELVGTVDPEGNPLTGCRFRWVTDSVHTNAGFEKWAATEMVRFGETVPCEESSGEIGSGTEPVTVHAQISGLEPGKYWVRLEGENEYEDGVAGGVLFEVVVPEVGKGCPHDPGCGPPAVIPPVVGPPEGTPPTVTPPGKAKAAPQPRKQRKGKHRKRLRRNAAIATRAARR